VTTHPTGVAPDPSAGIISEATTAIPPGLELVPSRPLVEDHLDVRFALAAGDRSLVASGETVVAGAPLIERLRDAHLEEIPVLPDVDHRRPGDRWVGEFPARVPALHHRSGTASGELLFETDGRWRVVSGERTDQVDAPADGIVREVRPGIGITLEVGWHALRGAFAIGGPTRGRLEIASEAGGEVRAVALDVGRAGTILVVGSRVDAEALTRARAMDVRGIVVAALPGKEQRDFGASETRQRAALHALPPFGLLVLDGVLRRPIASSIMRLLQALEGRDVAIVADPPALLFRDRPPSSPEPDRVRVRHGASAGREGRWLGLAGSRRFGAGTHLEAGLVRFDEGDTIAVPLADLERYV
jgi:hypothetical protein